MVGGGQWVEKLREDRPPLIEVMREVLQEREAVCKNKRDPFGPQDWPALYALDYQKEFEALTQWFEKLLTETPPTPDINGLYFCLLPNPLPSPYSTVALFVSGSRDQEINPRDWNRDNHWTGDDSVYNSPLLTSIYEAFVPPNTSWSVDERDMALFICWQWCGLVVTEWMCGPLRHKMLGVAPKRHIEVGLDRLIRFNLGDLTHENAPTV